MTNHQSKSLWVLKELAHRLLVLLGAVGLTLLLFLVLPLMQTLSKPPSTDMIVQSVDTAKLDAPPPPPQEEPEEEPQQEQAPPELNEEAPPLDLSQLELALNPGISEGWTTGDFAVKLNTVVSSGENGVDALFSVADLDQTPRVIYQPGPMLTKELRKKAPGTVYIIFVVDQQGRVENPMVQKASDPIFEKPALNAVKQWKFEPGKRNGKPVRFRMRVPFTFPKG
ncbi:MAG: energy transducer TonB [Sedimentisphaerales bacterium]|nr:energy transducer TonB [Sedimentisphaerales bacterium]